MIKLQNILTEVEADLGKDATRQFQSKLDDVLDNWLMDSDAESANWLYKNFNTFKRCPGQGIPQVPVLVIIEIAIDEMSSQVLSPGILLFELIPLLPILLKYLEIFRSTKIGVMVTFTTL